MISSSITLETWQALIGVLLGGISIALSLVALLVSMRTARNDLINTNSWETYQAYNEKTVRHGRALALRILRETSGKGLQTYADYRRYFALDAPGVKTFQQANTIDASTIEARRQERQYLHDLASFYHQAGVLLRQNSLDRDFTLLLLGPGLDDRWPVMKPSADYYRDEGEQDEAFPYGGMYLLYLTYRR